MIPNPPTCPTCSCAMEPDANPPYSYFGPIDPGPPTDGHYFICRDHPDQLVVLADGGTEVPKRGNRGKSPGGSHSGHSTGGR